MGKSVNSKSASSHERDAQPDAVQQHADDAWRCGTIPGFARVTSGRRGDGSTLDRAEATQPDMTRLSPGGTLAKTTRRQRTQKKLLDAAERLFAAHGVELVSLRDIGREAGTANKYSVQYHFGDRIQLIQAVFERRLPALDRRREELLAEAVREGRSGNLRDLVEILFRPLSEASEEAEENNYSGFLLNLLHYDGGQETRSFIDDLSPVAIRLMTLIYAQLPEVPRHILEARVLIATMTYLEAMRFWERRAGAKAADAYVGEAVSIATAIIAAPATDRAALALSLQAAGDAQGVSEAS